MMEIDRAMIGIGFDSFDDADVVRAVVAALREQGVDAEAVLGSYNGADGDDAFVTETQWNAALDAAHAALTATAVAAATEICSECGISGLPEVILGRGCREVTRPANAPRVCGDGSGGPLLCDACAAHEALLDAATRCARAAARCRDPRGAATCSPGTRPLGE